jgi:hypothetical protein
MTAEPTESPPISARNAVPTLPNARLLIARAG